MSWKITDSGLQPQFLGANEWTRRAIGTLMYRGLSATLVYISSFCIYNGRLNYYICERPFSRGVYCSIIKSIHANSKEGYVITCVIYELYGSDFLATKTVVTSEIYRGNVMCKRLSSHWVHSRSKTGVSLIKYSNNFMIFFIYLISKFSVHAWTWFNHVLQGYSTVDGGNHMITRSPFQYPIIHRIVRSREVSKPRNWYLELSDRSEIWQTLRRHRCRCACQTSKRCDDSNCQSRGFGTSRDLKVRRLIGYWNGAQIIHEVTSNEMDNQTIPNYSS